MTRAIQLSSKSVEHYGPEYLAPMIREAFGGPIHVDPASCAQANLLIEAQWYFSDRGLDREWRGNVYLNPPGGRVAYQGRKVNSSALWYASLAHRFEHGVIDQAVFMVFNLELFRYTQEWCVRHPLEHTICFPKRRIDFWKPGPDGHPVPQGMPGHPNAIVYMGSRVLEFRTTFSDPRPGTDWEGGKVFSPDGWWERYQT